MENKILSVPDSIKWILSKRELISHHQIKAFYKNRNYTPFWTNQLFPSEKANQIIQLFGEAFNYGLNPNKYNITILRKLHSRLIDTIWHQKNENKTILQTTSDFECLLTNYCLIFLSHLKTGTIYPDSLIHGRYLKQFPDSFWTILSNIPDTANFISQILAVQPKTQSYINLQKGLEIFLKNNTLSNKKIVLPDYKTDSVACYKKAKKIIKQSEYLRKSPVKTEVYVKYAIDKITNPHKPHHNYTYTYQSDENSDSLFIHALKAFQSDNGINQDGIIGKITWEALQKTNMQRYKQIATTLEQLRWENQMPEKYVLVNIPSYKLYIIVKDSIIETFRVVTGAVRTPTPELTSQIEYFISFPEWHVPQSIKAKEILPKLRKDSSYLKRNNFILLSEHREQINAEAVNWNEISASKFSFSVIQQGGAGNALGNIKFIFPNPYSVYIHDTQQKHLFGNDIRAYSHGCIRLHNPVDFGVILLNLDNKQNMVDTFRIAMRSHKKMYFYLKNPIPVYIRYFTCEADNFGNIIFYKDIYKREEKIRKKLFLK